VAAVTAAACVADAAILVAAAAQAPIRANADRAQATVVARAELCLCVPRDAGARCSILGAAAAEGAVFASAEPAVAAIAATA